jgi:hypothetical protein
LFPPKLTLVPSLPPSLPLSFPHILLQQVQQYVAHVTTQTKHNIGVKTEAEKAAALKAKKEAKEKEDVELKLLFMQVWREGGREGMDDGRRATGDDSLHRLTSLFLPPSFPQMQAGAGKTSKAMEAAAEAEKAKRDAAMVAKGGKGEAQWIEIDMEGKPLEEVGREGAGMGGE